MQWSKSKLNTMRQCPLKFKLSYIDLIPQPEAHEDLKKGVILHDAFNKFYDESRENRPTLGTMYETLKKLDIKQKFVDRYSNHILNFMLFNSSEYFKYNENFKPYQRETHYEFDNIHGIIDRIDYKDGKYILIDYKTSNGDDITSYEDELIFYSYLFQQNTGKLIDEIGIFFTGNQTKPITKQITQEQIESTMQNIFAEIKLYNKIIVEPDKLNHNEGYWCRWCPYTKLCPCKNK